MKPKIPKTEKSLLSSQEKTLGKKEPTTDERERKMYQTYVILFKEYKRDLLKLGVPISDFTEEMLLSWFDAHLKDIEEGG